MPTVVLFKTGLNLLTLAFVQRRPNLRNPERDVLGRVSLIREINVNSPHRAHLEIVASLSLIDRLEWINTKGKGQNFDGLLEAWLEALDTEKLNRQFYRDLYVWFLRAVKEAKFPTQERQVLSPEEHIIRLITRLLFIWFIKEKGLVAKELFVEQQIKHYLKNYDRSRGDSYYRVVLQNLFFATLNTQISKRGFSKQNQSTHRDFSHYRYKEEIVDTEILLGLFRQTPFINGGLFECLDSFESYTAGGYRIDCFTDNVIDSSKREHKILSVPNRLLFDEKGLITLFNRYKFTIEESTPIEKEVALDPELLGKVFENLLASYNPETRETARKATGSYYTPQEVVNYMVDEALIESIVTRVEIVDSDKNFHATLRYLLDYEVVYDDTHTCLREEERKRLVQYISEIKVLDPAVGSGAFPIGILHKLTLMLLRLDPGNIIWSRIQRDSASRSATRAFDTDDPIERANELSEINEIFEAYRDSDFGRKLFLIQNSIFGVDIQPIACQIAKLRFFISLAIEQESTVDIESNYGIRPLPNLETRFVAANTLIGLERSQQELQTPAVLQLKQGVAKNREHYFHANTRDQKKEYYDKDEELRCQLADALQEIGFSDNASKKIASWDPYDQKASANWFDPEYMFNVKDGFDIVIGNPPYVKVEHLDRGTRNVLKQEYEWIGDLYDHFIIKGLDLCASAGLFSYIANDSFVALSSKQKIRERLLENQIIRLVRSPSQTFEASIYVAIFVLKKESTTHSHKYLTGEFVFDGGLKYRTLGEVSYKDVHSLPGNRLLLTANNLLMRLLLIGQKVNHYYNILDTGIHSGNVRDKIFSNIYREGLECLLQGKQIQRYLLYWDSPRAKYKYCDINYSPLPIPGIGRGGKPSSKNEYWHFCGDIENHHQPERLLMRQTDDDLVVAYHNKEQHGSYYTDNTLFTILPKRDEKDLKFLMALLNSRLMNYIYHALSQEQGKSQAQVKVKTVRELPIVLPGQEDRSRINDLVERILLEKTKNPLANTSALEGQIDNIIYQLYRLTEDEISEVEGR